VCWSHLKRDFRRHADGLAEQKTFGEQGPELTGRVFAAWRAYQQEPHDRDRLKAEIAPIRTQLRRLLEEASPSRRTRWPRRFANNLLKVWPALWTFTTIDTAELTGLAIRSPKNAVDWRRRAGPTNTTLEAAQIRPSGRGA
jgi:Transposase IS66 family